MDFKASSRRITKFTANVESNRYDKMSTLINRFRIFKAQASIVISRSLCLKLYEKHLNIDEMVLTEKKWFFPHEFLKPKNQISPTTEHFDNEFFKTIYLELCIKIFLLIFVCDNQIH